MKILRQDLRYTFRLLWKDKSFAAIAIFTLALGIGANTAIFSVVDAALLRPLPYREPDRLVHLWEATTQKQFGEREASYPDYLDWKEQNQTLEGVAGYQRRTFTLTGRDAPDLIRGAGVTDNFFQVLGVEPQLGRAFQSGEDKPGAELLVMLGNSLWKQRFNSDPNIVGQSLMLNGASYRVVGVLPQSFQFAPGAEAQVWVPLNPSPQQQSRRYMHWLNIVARLKPGVTPEQARADLGNVARRITEAHPDSHTGTHIRVVGLHEQIIGNVKPILLVLLCTVCFVLLIACANVANLLLARSASRQKEIAIRTALGASHWRLLRQLLTESSVLGLMGGALGMLLAVWGVDLLVSRLPEAQLSAMPYLRGLSMNRTVLLFTLGVSLLTGMVFGLAPALQSAKLNLQETLKEGGRTSSASSHRRLRNLFVVSEIALALLLLVGAGLMMKSLVRLLEVSPGFNPDNLLTMRVPLPATKYPEDANLVAFHRELLERVETLPGVKGVATVSVIPLTGGNTSRFMAEDRPAPPPGTELEANTRDITPNYFDVMNVPLIRGRAFSEQDKADSPPVAIVNQTFANRLYPGEDAVGKRLLVPSVQAPPVEIVGVVADEKVTRMDVATTPVLYSPYLQDPGRMLNLVIRTSSDPGQLTASVRSEIQRLDADLPVFDVRTMQEVIDRSPSTFLRRYPAFLIGTFAAISLVLAVIGIYGVISYSVTQRTQEIGVRMALGAQRRDILKMIIGQGMLLALLGVSLGLVAAFLLTRFLESLLFNVSARDPLVYTGVSLLLIVVALLACYIPARRATRVDPMTALRYE
ncbi:MAG TPA: ABC transporter permease [Pyrinomonadaceae bacterium]|nr:ABC transporter permease [Pyrinomonadaceae bacterium]